MLYVVAGVVLSALGWYDPLVDFAGAGATVPLIGYGHLLAQGVMDSVAQSGLAVSYTHLDGYKRQVLYIDKLLTIWYDSVSEKAS